jgi:Uma2 family endonuclease
MTALTIELLSPSDTWKQGQQKMAEYSEPSLHKKLNTLA